MKKKLTIILSLLCLMVQGTWAQTSVESEQELKAAIVNGADIKLTANILLSNYLNIEGVDVTIDLNGFKLYRNLSEHDRAGHVIWVHGGSILRLKSSKIDGRIEGGKANNGGAIHIPYGNTVTAYRVTFQNNSAADHAGAIFNNGTFLATNCFFKNNSANDVGAVYNAVTADGAGAAELRGCTFRDNVGTAGAGALANAMGNSVMTIDGCTITENSASTYGAGIWNGGTLYMQGSTTVQDNTYIGGVASNVYLKSGKLITVTGSLTGSNIGVEMENNTGAFTSDYNYYNSGVAPNTIFTADRSIDMNVELGNNGEACLTKSVSGSVSYIERSWDDWNDKVVGTEKGLTTRIAYDATPVEGQYKEVTNAPDNNPDEWFGMGGYSTSVPEFYVVRGNVNRETIVVQGKNVHLVLCDGATLTLTGGLKLEGDNKLYIHSQSYRGEMGRLIVTNKYDNAAGIGSAQENGAEKKVGELVIYGGHIEATGGEYGAGIGSCARVSEGEGELCNRVTVYGGYVKATGGISGAGIGGGSGYKNVGIRGGVFILYDGTVVAEGGELAAGVGGGGSYYPAGKDDWGLGGLGNAVTVYGGSLTAIGGTLAAGIGSGPMFSILYYNGNDASGGSFKMYGGTVTATGGFRAAGIGGGNHGSAALVYVYGGMVTATGGGVGTGIGGGFRGKGCHVAISGGTVIAQGGDGQRDGVDYYRAFGAGSDYESFGTLSIGDNMMVGAGDNGSVGSIFVADERENGCWFHSHAEVSTCTHPSGVTYTIDGADMHSTHCKHCGVSKTSAHYISDPNGVCICGYKDSENYCTVTLATSSDGTNYEGVGVMAKVGKNMPYTLPECSSIPEGYDFAGWVVNPQSQENGILSNEGETMLAAYSKYTVTTSVSIFARYKPLAIILADKSDNTEKLYNYNGKKAASVTLIGRTLAKDGTWNSLCLPFTLDSFAGTPLEGATVKTLASATFEDGTLMLTFEDASEIVAGKPYIVKWAGQTSGNVENPTFEGVTINNTLNPVETDAVTFQGIYAPYYIGGAYKGMLYLDTDNKLCTPTTEMTINAQRAFFQLTSSGDLFGDVNGDGEINVADVTMTVDYILGKEPAGFIIDNADVNGDESIDITDVTVLVDIILSGNNTVLKNVVVNGAEGISFGED